MKKNISKLKYHAEFCTLNWFGSLKTRKVEKVEKKLFLISIDNGDTFFILKVTMWTNQKAGPSKLQSFRKKTFCLISNYGKSNEKGFAVRSHTAADPCWNLIGTKLCKNIVSSLYWILFVLFVLVFFHWRIFRLYLLILPMLKDFSGVFKLLDKF